MNCSELSGALIFLTLYFIVLGASFWLGCNMERIITMLITWQSRIRHSLADKFLWLATWILFIIWNLARRINGKPLSKVICVCLKTQEVNHTQPQ